MYLLDTNVVSELRKKKPHGAVVAWLEMVEEHDLHLSAVTIGEIQAGIEITREHDLGKATEIEVWLNEVGETYNVLSLDGAIFRIWAKLMHKQAGQLIEDALIAATALQHGLTVVTRNRRDFSALGVDTINPFVSA